MSNDDYKRVGPIVAERDDEDDLSPFPQHDGRRARSREKVDPVPRSKPTEGRRSGGTGSRVFTVVLALAVLGLVAYAIHLNQLGAETRTNLENLQARFDHLEGQIMSTDESLSQSGAAIQAKLREVDSEIRKLWGVSNDRNRKAIAANEEAIKKLTATVSQVEQTSGSQVGTMKALQSKVDQFERGIGSANAEVLAVKAEIEQIKGRLNIVNAAAERIEATTNRVNNLDSRVRSHEEAIQSIDAFRRQTNQSLLQLRQQLGVQ